MPVRIKIPASLILLPIAFGLAACSAGESAQQPPAPEPLAVDSVLPGRSDLVASQATTATLEAFAAAGAHAKVAGQVVELFVEEGDTVTKGQALARLDGDRLRLTVQKAQAELSQLQNELNRAKTLAARGLVSQSALEGLEYSVAQRQAAWELQRLELDYSVIRAPIAGTVAARAIRLGQQLTEGARAFEISDTSQLVAELKIPQVDLHRFAPGQPVLVRPDALPELGVAAQVDRISPTINANSGTFRLTVYVDNADQQLAPGMFARISIGYQKHEDAMILPASAIRSEDGVQVVYVIREGAAERRVVDTGIQQDQQVEILSGLSSDERVFRRAAEGLLYGNRVLATTEVTVASGG